MPTPPLMCACREQSRQRFNKVLVMMPSRKTQAGGAALCMRRERGHGGGGNEGCSWTFASEGRQLLPVMSGCGAWGLLCVVKGWRPQTQGARQAAPVLRSGGAELPPPLLLRARGVGAGICRGSVQALLRAIHRRGTRVVSGVRRGSGVSRGGGVSSHTVGGHHGGRLGGRDEGWGREGRGGRSQALAAGAGRNAAHELPSTRSALSAGPTQHPPKRSPSSFCFFFRASASAFFARRRHAAHCIASHSWKMNRMRKRMAWALRKRGEEEQQAGGRVRGRGAQLQCTHSARGRKSMPHQLMAMMA